MNYVLAFLGWDHARFLFYDTAFPNHLQPVAFAFQSYNR